MFNEGEIHEIIPSQSNLPGQEQHETYVSLSSEFWLLLLQVNSQDKKNTVFLTLAASDLLCREKEIIFKQVNEKPGCLNPWLISLYLHHIVLIFQRLEINETIMLDRKTFIQEDVCAPLFIGALSTIANTWNQPRCSTTDEWIMKMWCTYAMEYCIASCKAIIRFAIT